MQYVWQHRLLPSADLRTVDGRSVQVLDPGRLNTESGPDFFNAKIQIGDKLWVGDVEVHVLASDWHRHGHDGDEAYRSVVLHVVDSDDARILRPDGGEIPQLVMRCTPELDGAYAMLREWNSTDLACAPYLPTFASIHVSDWIGSLVYERLYAKADRFTEILGRHRGDWEETAYIMLARSLGFNTNAEPMQRLAAALPLHFVRKHADSLTALEALLFGQAGVLDAVNVEGDAYLEHLRREYRFFAHKFSLPAPVQLGWKLNATRPVNHVYRRIALLAAMLHGDTRFVQRILDMRSVDEAVELFRQPLSEYWRTHYTFGRPSPRPIEGLSRASTELLIINLVAPLTMAYGTVHGKTAFTEQAADWLARLPAESNAIVRLFAGAGIEARDALTSQALVHLRKEYCLQRKCLQCRFGHRILATKSANRRLGVFCAHERPPEKE